MRHNSSDSSEEEEEESVARRSTRPLGIAASSAGPAARSLRTSVDRRRLLFPPSWPQLPQSTLQSLDVNIPQLKSIDEWQQDPPQNRDGQLSKIAYALCNNADHHTAYHFIPEDVTAALGWDAWEHISSYRRAEFGMQWQKPVAHGATCDGEYCVVESSALPLYLQHVFGEKHELFEMVALPLALLQGVIECIHRFLGSSKQNMRMEDLFEEHCLRVPDEEKAKEAVQALTAVWEQLLECDVCVVPSVLLMSKKHTANEWYERLKLLEKEAKLTVFPFIDVESKMENKDSYFTALMSSRRPYELLEHKVKSTIIAEPSAAPAVTEPLTQRIYGVDWTYRAHNGRTAPTAIIPSVSQLFEQPEGKQLNFMQHITCLLRAEVEKAGWQVHEPELWVIKGLNSTRSNVMRKCKDIKEMIMHMQTAAENGMKLVRSSETPMLPEHCAPQPGFLVQPCMKGLEWECRTYFNRGEYMFCLMSDQPPNQGQDGTVSAFNTLEMRGHQRISHNEFALIQPQMIDFSIDILRECEEHCQLVSKSGVLRVDLGAEFIFCDPAQSEEELRAAVGKKHQLNQQWHCTGAGFIVRFFLNEVTSTLDINWFSQQTNYPIVYEAAYVTSQLLLDIVAAKGKEGLLKTERHRPEVSVQDPLGQKAIPKRRHRKAHPDHVCEFGCARDALLGGVAAGFSGMPVDGRDRRADRSMLNDNSPPAKRTRKKTKELLERGDDDDDDDGEYEYKFDGAQEADDRADRKGSAADDGEDCSVEEIDSDAVLSPPEPRPPAHRRFAMSHHRPVQQRNRVTIVCDDGDEEMDSGSASDDSAVPVRMLQSAAAAAATTEPVRRLRDLSFQNYAPFIESSDASLSDSDTTEVRERKRQEHARLKNQQD